MSSKALSQTDAALPLDLQPGASAAVLSKLRYWLRRPYTYVLILSRGDQIGFSNPGAPTRFAKTIQYT